MVVSCQIGLISDTHGRLPNDVKTVFENVDAILHAGDIGSTTVIQQLEALAPVTAVRGNCDSALLAVFYEEMELAEFAGHKIVVVHKLYEATSLVNKGFQGVVVFGHTHNPETFQEPGVLFINPGSPVQPRRLDHGTVAIMTLTEGLAPAFVFHEIGERLIVL